MKSTKQISKIDAKPLSPAIAKLLIAAQETYQQLVRIVREEQAKHPPRLDKG